MVDRPILFSGAMVRALLAGTKSQTRRAIKPQPHSAVHQDCETGEWGQLWYSLDERHDPTVEHWKALRCPYGATGDTLWVREAWRTELRNDGIRPRDLGQSNPIYYDAGGGGEEAIPSCAGRGRPSIHMPRWASRISLKITDVRVERLQDISEADAIAEAIARIYPAGSRSDTGPNHFTCEFGGGWHNAPTAAGVYRYLWEHINGYGSWEPNPWVWIISFERLP